MLVQMQEIQIYLSTCWPEISTSLGSTSSKPNSIFEIEETPQKLYIVFEIRLRRATEKRNRKHKSNVNGASAGESAKK